MKYSICSHPLHGFPIMLLDGERSGIPTDPEKEFWEEIQRLRRENEKLQQLLSPNPIE